MALTRVDRKLSAGTPSPAGRRSRIASASVQTTLLGGLLNCFLCFLIVGFHPYPDWPEMSAIGIRLAPPPDWLDDPPPPPEVVVRVDRWFLEVQEPEDLAQRVPLSDRDWVRGTLRLLRRRAPALILAPEDGANTQGLVQVTDDARAAGWSEVDVRLEP